MKKTDKTRLTALMFTAAGIGCMMTGCTDPAQTVYGPPPVEMQTFSTESEYAPQEVYGPPPVEETSAETTTLPAETTAQITTGTTTTTTTATTAVSTDSTAKTTETVTETAIETTEIPEDSIPDDELYQCVYGPPPSLR